MSSPYPSNNFTAGTFGTHNVPQFYWDCGYRAFSTPNFYPREDWNLPIFPDPPNPAQHLKETSNVSELIIEPYLIDIDPGDVQSGYIQWASTTVPESGYSNFYPDPPPTDGESDFYPDPNLLINSTFYPGVALGGSTNVVPGLVIRDC